MRSMVLSRVQQGAAGAFASVPREPRQRSSGSRWGRKTQSEEETREPDTPPAPARSCRPGDRVPYQVMERLQGLVSLGHRWLPGCLHVKKELLQGSPLFGYFEVGSESTEHSCGRKEPRQIALQAQGGFQVRVLHSLLLE